MTAGKSMPACSFVDCAGGDWRGGDGALPAEPPSGAPGHGAPGAVRLRLAPHQRRFLRRAERAVCHDDHCRRHRGAFSLLASLCKHAGSLVRKIFVRATPVGFSFCSFFSLLSCVWPEWSGCSASIWAGSIIR